MKKLHVAASVMMFMCVACTTIPSEEARKMENLLARAPCSDSRMGKRKLVDEEYLLMMQAALKPGQTVPQQNANSSIHIIILDGEVVVNLSGQDITARKGKLDTRHGTGYTLRRRRGFFTRAAPMDEPPIDGTDGTEGPSCKD